MFIFLLTYCFIFAIIPFARGVIMATIVNEGTKDYRVTRNSIYVGSVVKLKNGSKLTDDLSIVNCEKYRTILFSKNEDNNAVDLLYKSPLYPIFGYNDNIDQDNLFVTGACSLEEILEFYGFNYLLYYTVYSSLFQEDI